MNKSNLASSFLANRRSQPLCLLLLALVIASFSANAKADLVASLDFNNGFSGRTQSGAAAVGSAGDTWNGSASFFNFVGTEASGNTGNTPPFVPFELLDPTGASSGVSYQMTFVNDGIGFNGAFDAAAASTQAAGTEDLTGDYLFVGTADAGDSMNFEISGLTNNTDYQLYLYGVGDAANQGATWTLNGTSQTTSYDGNITLDEGADYVVFNFNTGANTSQSFIATELAGNIAVNGFQIFEATAIPEPSSIVLVSLATLIGLPIRRRSP